MQSGPGSSIPRSLDATRTLRGLYIYRRSYSQAIEVGDDALASAPSDPQNIQGQAMIFLAQGDLAGARRVIASAPGALGQPALVAYLATYNDLYWVLTDEQQQVLLRLPPSAFFDDPAAWGSVFMQTLWVRGDKARARAYADTAHRAFQEQLKGAPSDAQLHVLDGLALAYMGRKDEAIAQGEQGMALSPITKDARERRLPAAPAGADLPDGRGTRKGARSPRAAAAHAVLPVTRMAQDRSRFRGAQGKSAVREVAGGRVGG